jgi:signal transduction histidine kinase
MKNLTIRAMLALLFVGILIISGGFVLLCSWIVEKTFLQIIPPNLVDQFSSSLQALLMYQSVAILLFAIFLASLAFWIVGSAVATPLSKILIAMNAFAEKGERMPMPDLKYVPSEISSLTTVFARFMDKVEQSHEKDTEISRVKSDFISTAAHQLRTPLTGIRWALEALQNEQLTEDQKALVKSAVDKSHDLVAIVGTLLDISSIESGKYNYQFAMMDLTVLVGEVSNDFIPLAGQRQVSLINDPLETAIPQVRADRDRIKWILNNLIENAIRYTPAGGSIHISIGVVATQIQVRVTDTGIGIPQQERGNIFERFYRAGNAIAKENAGNGLGLYIARTIANDHGGDLDFIQNTNGPGTTFILSFPVVT